MKRALLLNLVAVSAVAPLLFGSGATAQCAYVLKYKIPAAPCPWPWGPKLVYPAKLTDDFAWAGSRSKCPLNDNENIPLRWTPATGLQVVPTPANIKSATAYTTNQSGMVGGTFSLQGQGVEEQPCVWMPDGQFIILPQLEEQWTGYVWDLNAAGVAVGYRIPITGGSRPFTWHNGVLVEIEVPPGFANVGNAEKISDSGIVAGSIGISSCGGKVFRWTAGAGMEILDPLPGCVGAFARTGVTNDGTVLGRSLLPGAQECFSSGWITTLWRGHDPEPVLPLEGHERTAVGDINNKGVMVGFSFTQEIPGAPLKTGTIWYKGVPHGFIELVVDGSTDGFTPAQITPIQVSERGEVMVNAPVPLQTWQGIVNPTGTWLFEPVSAPEGDLDGDCVVDGADIAKIISEWGKGQYSVADINKDGVVNGADLAMVLGTWTPVKPR